MIKPPVPPYSNAGLSARIDAVQAGDLNNGSVELTKLATSVLDEFRFEKVDSIDSLRAVAGVSLPDNTFLQLLGYDGAGSKGHGLFYLDKSDDASPDNGGTIIVADDGYRWKRAGLNVLRASDFGIVGGTGNDQSAELEAFIENFSGNNTIIFDAGVTYEVSRSDIRFKNKAIVIAYGATFKWVGDTYSTGGHIFKLAPQTTDFQFHGGIIDANESENNNCFAISTSPGQPAIYHNRVLMSGVVFKNSKIYAPGEVSNQTLFSGGGKGLTIQFKAEGVIINNCQFIDNDIGFSIEAAVSEQRYSHAITFSNCVVRGAGRAGCYLLGSSEGSSLDPLSYNDSRFGWCLLNGILFDECATDAVDLVDMVDGEDQPNYSTCGIISMNYAVGVNARNIISRNSGKVTPIRGTARGCSFEWSSLIADDIEYLVNLHPMPNMITQGIACACNYFDFSLVQLTTGNTGSNIVYAATPNTYNVGLTGQTGTWSYLETISFVPSGATARLLYPYQNNGSRLVYEVLSGVPANGDVATGGTSGTTAIIGTPSVFNTIAKSRFKANFVNWKPVGVNPFRALNVGGTDFYCVGTTVEYQFSWLDESRNLYGLTEFDRDPAKPSAAGSYERTTKTINGIVEVSDDRLSLPDAAWDGTLFQLGDRRFHFDVTNGVLRVGATDPASENSGRALANLESINNTSGTTVSSVFGNLIVFSSAAPRTVTSISPSLSGKELYVRFSDTNVTLSSAAFRFNNGTTSFTPAAADTVLHFINSAGVWYEVGAYTPP